jgi:asparagine synthase (glutamine-hydrolysing)
MASSVELRLPFLDHRLVETIIGLRKNYSDAGLAAKAWLKEAVTDLVPPWVLHRPKRGFEPPRHLWHQVIFQAYGNRLLDGWLVNHGVLDVKAARVLASGPFSAKAGSSLSFKALVLEMWCREISRIRHTTSPAHETQLSSAVV